MNPETALWLSLGAALLALVYGVVSAKWILSRSAGSERIQAIATAIQEGAKAYINRQYTTIGIVGAVLFAVLLLALDWGTAVGFAIGACSRYWPAISACSYPCAPTCVPPRPPPKGSTPR